MYKYNKINAHIFLKIFDNLQKDDALNLIKKKENRRKNYLFIKIIMYV